MTLHGDGSAACDRCGLHLDGLGVLYGMICTDLDADEQLTQRIFCYANGCADIAVGGLTTVAPGEPIPDPGTCLACPIVVASTVDGMLAAILDRDDTRQLRFCYTNGHRDELLARACG